jgi:hypothetical protein
MSRNTIAAELRKNLLKESAEVDEFIKTIKDGLVKAKNEFKKFLDDVTKGDFPNVDTEDVAKSVKTSASGAALLKDVAFRARVGEVADNLGVDSSALIKIMNKESGLKPHAQNPRTKATGLIQFMPKTAERLGTTVDELKDMSALEQMDYVEQYFRPYRGKVHNYEDLYLVTFFPAALGKPEDWVMRTKKTSAELISKQNPVIARAAGKQPGEPLTVGDFRKYARSRG